MYTRFFLNRKTGHAFVEVDAQNVAEKRAFSADVTIADCSRMVTLEFHCNKTTRAAKLRKLRDLIGALTQLEAELAAYKFGTERDDY